MSEPGTPQHDFGVVFAVRELQSDFGPVRITMGAPRPTDDGEDYLCVYDIQGPRTTKRSFAIGIDAFQAIELTLQKIGVDLLYSEEGRLGQLRWFETPGETGFPVPPGHEV